MPLVIHVNRIHDYGQLLQQFGISNAVEVETQITVSCMSVEEQRTKQISEIIDDGIDQCIFDEYMLFILPFQAVDNMKDRMHNALEFRASMIGANTQSISANAQNNTSTKPEMGDNNSMEPTFIGKTSINMNEYEIIWRRQGQEHYLSPRASVSSKYPKYSIVSEDPSIYQESDYENEEYVLESNEKRFKRQIRTRQNPINLEYTLNLGALKIYQEYGLKYIDNDVTVLDAAALEDIDFEAVTSQHF